MSSLRLLLVTLVLGAASPGWAQSPTSPVGAAGGAPSPPAAPAGTGTHPTLTAPAATARPRLAITEVVVEGEGATPALTMQLQDGFVLALVRAGYELIDPADLAKRLANAPELHGCDTSPCLKRLGDLLGVRFVIRLHVTNTGNSYRMTARLFSTEGAAPAALPVAAQSRACDVCTVGEAREQMIRLADGLRPRIEEHGAPPPPPQVPTDDRRIAWQPWAAVAAGALTIVAGALIARAADPGARRQTALGGALMGIGLTTSVVGLYASFAYTTPGADTSATPGPAAVRLSAGARFAF